MCYCIRDVYNKGGSLSMTLVQSASCCAAQIAAVIHLRSQIYDRSFTCEYVPCVYVCCWLCSRVFLPPHSHVSITQQTAVFIGDYSTLAFVYRTATQIWRFEPCDYGKTGEYFFLYVLYVIIFTHNQTYTHAHLFFSLFLSSQLN